MAAGMQNTAPSGFPSLLREYRQRRRQSLSALAEAAGYDHSYGSRLESGTRIPTREAVQRYADALGLTGHERDALLASAGFLPTDINNLYANEPVIVDLATLLADRSIEASTRDHVRYVTGLLVEEARRTCRTLELAAD